MNAFESRKAWYRNVTQETLNEAQLTWVNLIGKSSSNTRNAVEFAIPTMRQNIVLGAEMSVLGIKERNPARIAGGGVVMVFTPIYEAAIMGTGVLMDKHERLVLISMRQMLN